jgi:putative phage-type endonuclease
MNAQVETKTLLDTHSEYTAKILSGTNVETLTEDEQWHFRRRLGLGGSEAGTILGLNKYESSWDLWSVKTGRSEPKDLSDNMAVKMGHILEPIVADLYAEKTRKTVRRSNIHHIHKEKPWLVGNLDRVLVGEKRGLECKTASSFAAKGNFGKGNVYDQDGNLIEICDTVPDTYLIQVQHYMAVTGLPLFDLAVLIDGRDFRIFTIARNDELIAEIEGQLTDFWFNNVIADIAPSGEPIAEPEVIKGSTVEATDDITTLIESHKELDEAIKELKAEQDIVDTQIKQFIGESEILVHAGKQLASYKPVITNRFDSTAFKKADPATYAQYTKPSTSRTFRVS